MSSGFVSGGTTDAPIERSDEWLAVQIEIEANRARKAAQAQQPDGRSLFETLEANKAAKQEAFEEASRLKNQFRALDEDEAEFLDSVLESTRAEEDRVKRETAEGLEAFRRQQEEADKKVRRASSGEQNVEEASNALEEEQWAIAGRKRKRAKEKEGLKGVKIRRSSIVEEPAKGVASGASSSPPKDHIETPKTRSLAKTTQGDAKTGPVTPAVVSKAPPASHKPGLSLVDYGSDEDDE